MTVQNELLRTNSFVVYHERNCRITVCIKTGLICDNSFTGAVATIIKKQNVESVFREPLAHPPNARDVAAVSVKEDDGRGCRSHSTFEEPPVQAGPVSGVEPDILRSFRRRFAFVCRQGFGMESNEQFEPAQSVYE